VPTKPQVAVETQIVARDAAFAPLIAQVGPAPTFRTAPPSDRFGALVRTVVFQLLSTKAADTIHARVIAACGGRITPDSVQEAGPSRLRGAGLSNAKVATIGELAGQVEAGTVRLDRHARYSDDDVSRELLAVRGIGPWTVQVYLLFTLGRLDVWPVGDLGVRRGWGLVHGTADLITEKDLKAAGEVHRGHRSALAWYCWQAVHLDRGY
jgi:DNA-3-methyladenine glycosylase II